MAYSELISIIVPVYRVEPYLDRCVQSIVDQTYQNLEIILVDDGSPDNCPAMCDAWAAKDSRVKVIHKENGGLSDARNAGLAAAAGEYIGFVDSDDWISPDMYRLLYENMAEHGSDVSACGVEMVWEDRTPPRLLTKRGCCVLDQEEAMRAVIAETWIQAPVWYKLYKRELVRDIPFPVGKCHEDVFWTYQAVGNARKVSVFDTPCYHYTQRSGSIMGEEYSIKRLDSLEAKLLRIQYVQERYPSMVADAKRDLCFFCIWSEQKVLRCLQGTEKQLALANIHQVWRQLQNVRPRILKERVWLILARISLRGTAWMRNMLHIGL